MREPREMRRIVWITGSLWLVFALTNGLLEATIRDLIAHPNAHLAVGIVGDVMAIALLACGFLADDARLERRFEQFQARQRQFAAVLGAHGIAVTFAHCSNGDAADL